jgi:hypothetical protein
MPSGMSEVPHYESAFRCALGVVKLWRRASVSEASSSFPSPSLKYLFLKDLAGNGRKIRPQIRHKLLIYKYFTRKSLFLKDLAKHRR